MTVAVIALAVLCVALAGALIAAGWKLVRAAPDLASAHARGDAAILERNSAHVRNAELAATVHSLTAELSATRAALAAHSAKEADDAADRVRTADDPLAEFNRVFGAPILPVDPAPAAGGDGAAAAPLRATVPADVAAGPVGRAGS